MPIRERAGKWHYRFWVNGEEYSASTGLPATERNKTAALRKEAAARELVLAGRSSELRLQVVKFSDAVSMFLEWVTGEYREHPASARRLATSFASIGVFLKGKSVSAVTAGDVEDYKSFRRTVSQVREITLRHDLHALSVFFRFAKRHNWCRGNPVDDVEIPSDADAERIYVLSAEDEARYFAAIRELAAGTHLEAGLGRAGNLVIVRQRYNALYDAARIMLLQGVRPEEVMEARAENVRGHHWLIGEGKSKSARRTLRLTVEARAIMEARKATARNGWLWPGKFAGHVTTFQRTHDAALERAGLGFVIYDLRHTFATRAAASGMPVTTLAAVLGHRDLRCVMKYVHVRQQDIDAGMVMLDSQGNRAGTGRNESDEIANA